MYSIKVKCTLLLNQWQCLDRGFTGCECFSGLLCENIVLLDTGSGQGLEIMLRDIVNLLKQPQLKYWLCHIA